MGRVLPRVRALPVAGPKGRPRRTGQTAPIFSVPPRLRVESCPVPSVTPVPSVPVSPSPSIPRYTMWMRSLGLAVVSIALLCGSVAAQQAPDLNKILADIRAKDNGQLAVSEEDGKFLRLLVASTCRKRALA